MITGIRVHNMHSIKDAEIEFEKGRYQYLNDHLLHNEIPNPIAFYGLNGSGKTSIIHALRDLVILLSNDQKQSFPFIRNLYFLGETETSISINFIIDNRRFLYYIKTNYEIITEEQLFENKEEIFSRHKDIYKYNDEEEKIEGKLFPALRWIANKKNPDNIVWKIYEYLTNITVVEADKKTAYTQALGGNNFYDTLVDKSDEVKEILRTYDSFPLYDVKSRIMNDGRKVYSVHIETEENNDVEIPYSFLSTGMKDQSFLLSLLVSLPKNGTLIIDEIEAALHPSAIKNFVDEVISKNIQLIFTSHNTNVLTNLRPDNIIFANWKNGGSSYKKLPDIFENIREVNNIEKMYLSHMFDNDIKS